MKKEILFSLLQTLTLNARNQDLQILQKAKFEAISKFLFIVSYTLAFERRQLRGFGHLTKDASRAPPG